MLPGAMNIREASAGVAESDHKIAGLTTTHGSVEGTQGGALRSVLFKVGATENGPRSALAGRCVRIFITGLFVCIGRRHLAVTTRSGADTAGCATTISVLAIFGIIENLVTNVRGPLSK
jgi:hypothetical protein